MSKDYDMYLFEARGHRQTELGLRLRIAMREGALAQSYIRQLMNQRKATTPRLKALQEAVEAAGIHTTKTQIETWRRAWIMACENASQAIGELVIERDWPPECRADLNYQWTPPPRRQPASPA